MAAPVSFGSIAAPSQHTAAVRNAMGENWQEDQTLVQDLRLSRVLLLACQEIVLYLVSLSWAANGAGIEKQKEGNVVLE